MNLDRENIVRGDFKRTVRGYDPWQVETHLRAVAQAVNQALDELAKGEGEMPPQIRDRVRARVSIAQLDAAEIVRKANEEAEARRAETDRMILDSLVQAAEEVDRMLTKARAEAQILRDRARADSELAARRHLESEAREAAAEAGAAEMIGTTPNGEQDAAVDAEAERALQARTPRRRNGASSNDRAAVARALATTQARLAAQRGDRGEEPGEEQPHEG